MSAWLCDTCVIIDYLRDRNEAVDFMRQASAPPSVSIVTVAELLAGVRNPTEHHRIEALLGQLSVHDVDLEIARLAGSYCHQYRRSHAVEIADGSIAATARAHGARLITRNVCHFPMLDDVLVPYRLS
jgi:predicted nucleic acid-binding protein